MAQAAIDAIDAARPYEGGTNELWCLHRLDIADKHHALLVTLVSVTAMVIQVPNLWWAGSKIPNTAIPQFSLPNFQTPLKDGDAFFTCEPGTEDNVDFGFDVALIEPEIVRGKPLLRVLQKLIDDVEGLVVRFKPMLA